MNKKLVVFDFDGTLVDSLPLIQEVLKEVLEEKGINLNQRRIKTLQRKGVISTLKSLNIPFYKLPIIFLKVQGRMGKRISEVGSFPGIPKLIEDLKTAGFELGIISNNKKKTVLSFLKENNLNYFNFVIGTLFFLEKNRRLKKASKKNQEKEIVYIGDQTGDVRAANQVGVISIAVDWGFDSEDKLRKENPNILASSPDEIYDFLMS
jgi:phosphoglycolate phosphatase